METSFTAARRSASFCRAAKLDLLHPRCCLAGSEPGICTAHAGCAHSPLGISSCDPLGSVDLDHGCESGTDDEEGEEGEVGVGRGREG